MEEYSTLNWWECPLPRGRGSDGRVLTTPSWTGILCKRSLCSATERFFENQVFTLYVIIGKMPWFVQIETCFFWDNSLYNQKKNFFFILFLIEENGYKYYPTVRDVLKGFKYRPFHKTFPRFSAFFNWISVRSFLPK